MINDFSTALMDCVCLFIVALNHVTFLSLSLSPLSVSLSVQSPPAGASVYPADIWGPTCDSMDKICEAVLPELFVGDWLVFEEMGAYTLSAHSGFNGFKRPHIYYYIHEEDQ